MYPLQEIWIALPGSLPFCFTRHIKFCTWHKCRGSFWNSLDTVCRIVQCLVMQLWSPNSNQATSEIILICHQTSTTTGSWILTHKITSNIQQAQKGKSTRWSHIHTHTHTHTHTEVYIHWNTGTSFDTFNTHAWHVPWITFQLLRIDVQNSFWIFW